MVHGPTIPSFLTKKHEVFIVYSSITLLPDGGSNFFDMPREEGKKHIF
jgi:hypothetical protein